MSSNSNPFAPAPEPETPLGRYRVLSSTAGIRVSPLQLGAMSIGEAWSGIMGSMNKDQSFALLDAFVSAGGNFIDTANQYQFEQSETWLGEWMAARQNRDRIVLATKYTMHYRDHLPDIEKGTAPNYSGNHKKSLYLSFRDSLKKLQTVFVDILYLHWWDYTTSVKEIMDALHVLVEQGKVFYLGISDTPAWIVAAANEYALSNGKTPFSIYQGQWNVMTRDFEREILPMARNYGMALAPWNVVGGGRFQTKAQIEAKKQAGEGLRTFGKPAEQMENEAKISAALEKVANDLSLTKGEKEGYYSLTAVAIAYVMCKAPRVFPVVGGRKVEHLMDNIKGLEIKLTGEQIKELEDVTDFDIGFPSNFIGPDPHINGGTSGRGQASSAWIDWLQEGNEVAHA